MVCHKLAPMTSSKTSTQCSHTYKWQNEQWFPMNNIRVVLAKWIITSALAAHEDQPPACQACIKWKLLLLEISTSMHTDYSFSACGTAYYRATWRVFEKMKYSLFAYKVHVSVCLQNSRVPALRESSCLSVTAALFFSEMWAKMLHVALQ